MKLRIIRATWLAEGVVGLDLADPAGAELPAWQPGAHLSLRLPNGLAREYSLCGDPAGRCGYRVAVQRDAASRGGSSYVHERLRVGEIIEADGPRNNFALEDAPAYVLIAGGIGITPVKPMAEALAARGAVWQLLYCGRSRDRMAFAAELGRLDGAGAVTLHADDEAGGPAGIAGYLAAAPAGALVYCCGPEPLLAAVRDAVTDPGRLRVELFRPPAATAAAAAEEAFDVVCSAGRFTVKPGASILGTLDAAGLSLPSSCQEGICGTCETRVLGGRPDHRDFLLSPEERRAGESMMICVSRSHTPELVLDL